MTLAALIPARANSKRIPGKALKQLNGVPLIAYTIAAAVNSKVFDTIVVCTDSDAVLECARQLGVETFRRNHSHDAEPDIQWVQRVLANIGAEWDAFSILRPTSPFRTAEMIRRAFDNWCGTYEGFDSLRAVEPVKQHPGKCWRKTSTGYLEPLLLQPSPTPWHSSPTQTLPPVYMQNASLEIAWTDTVHRTGTIAGDRVLAFETEGYEGFDLNTMDDWLFAEMLIDRGLIALPEVAKA